MTATKTSPRRPRPTPQVPAGLWPTERQVLRDAAFVLHLTQKVRGDILGERAAAAAPALAEARA
jgi:hypothetical protein